MASFMFNQSKQWREDWDSLPASSTVRVALSHTSTMVEATEQDVDTVSAITNLNEPTHGSYTRKAGTTSISVDDTNNRVEHRLAQIVWSALDGGDTIYGALVYYDPDDLDNDTTNIPIAWCELTATKTTNGGDFTVQFNGANPGAVFYGT